jgi:hypothetical protein
LSTAGTEKEEENIKKAEGHIEIPSAYFINYFVGAGHLLLLCVIL